MKRVSLRQLHEQTGTLVRNARRLGEVIVTDRGVPVARIVPIDSRQPVNPFRSRTLVPAYARLLRSGKLGRGTDSTALVSADRDHR